MTPNLVKYGLAYSALWIEGKGLIYRYSQAIIIINIAV